MRLFKKNIQPKKVFINKNDELKRPEIDFSNPPKTLEEFEGVVNLITQSIREQDKRFNDIDRRMDEITGVDYRITTIQDWLNAMRSADVPWNSSYSSSWVKLFDIFFNMVQDTHVQACINTLLEGVQSKDFYFADENGERIDEVTELFKAQWFYDYIAAIVNVRLWGFGLIQLQDYDGDSLSVREINRKHVRPDLGGLVRQQYDEVVFKKWTSEPFKTWTIYLFDSRLGQLNPCVRWYIYKTEIVRFWAKFNQLYGVPPIVAKTKVVDRTRKENMITMLKKWISSRWMVLDIDDEIEQFNATSSSSGQQYFENLIRLADEQISKALLGSTMVLDDGSSRSQSEVHETNTNKFINSICRLVKFTTDKELIPRLRKIGFQIPENARFIWDNSEKLTMKERSEILNSLGFNWDIDEAVASEFLGLEITKKEAEPETGFSPTKKELENIYKERMKNG